MADVREAILVRLFYLLVNSLEGINVALRNQDLTSETQLPAAVLFDGDELANDNDPKARPANSPRRVTMTPEIRVLLQEMPEGVGSKLNAMRAKLIKTVLNDAELLALTADGMGARYQGMVSALKPGRAIQGEMLCAFAFTYYLIPNDL